MHEHVCECEHVCERGGRMVGEWKGCEHSSSVSVTEEVAGVTLCFPAEPPPGLTAAVSRLPKLPKLALVSNILFCFINHVPGFLRKPQIEMGFFHVRF